MSENDSAHHPTHHHKGGMIFKNFLKYLWALAKLPILIIHSASADASAAKNPERRHPSSEVGWRLTFKVVDTLTVRPQMAGRPFEEQPHELYRI